MTQEESCDLVFGPWHFNPQKHQLHNGNVQIDLTPTEGKILHVLLNSGGVVTFSTIANELWENEYPGFANSIRVYVSRLRQKIERDPDHPATILTKIGVGYYLKR